MPATGPATEAGKAASSRNAVKHGLLSEAPVVTLMETAEEWESHRAGVLADLSPRGQMETCLAERAALLIWRLRRMAQAEICMIDDRHRNAPDKKKTHIYIPGFDAITCVTRYEAHLGRELNRTMKALHDLQSRPEAVHEPGEAALAPGELETCRSPLPDASGSLPAIVSERSLNGSLPLASTEPGVASAGETENCETNSPSECEASPSGAFPPAFVPLDDRSVDEHLSALLGAAAKNCETNSILERGEDAALQSELRRVHELRGVVLQAFGME